jgi:hypothetical protein
MVATPLVLKTLGEELAATLSNGVDGVALMVLSVGGGRVGDPGQAAAASALDSSAVGGDMPWV